MSDRYFLLYRFYFALRAQLARRVGSRLPESLQRARHALRLYVERLTFPKHRLNVRIRDGVSRGLWIRARLPEEASYWEGKRERETQQTIQATVHEGSVVYDVGAHIGVLTLGTARLVGETGRVVAFDADAENVDCLRASCTLNHFEGRIRVVHSAVWSYASPAVSFRRGGIRTSHGGVTANGYEPVRASGATVTVPATTLDAFIAAEGPPPELVKIDVEGGEYEVLRGGETLFTRVRPRILVEVHHAAALEQISNWIRKYRYSAQWRIPAQGFPRMLFAWPSESRPDL
jgi:FkbM family methyltransferase